MSPNESFTYLGPQSLIITHQTLHTDRITLYNAQNHYLHDNKTMDTEASGESVPTKEVAMKPEATTPGPTEEQTEIPAEPENAVKSISWLYWNESPEYDHNTADVEVFCGEEMVAFNMHLAKIMSKSDYFERALKMFYIEGQTREITLEDIKPSSFEVIAKWIYGGGFEIKDGAYDRDLVINTYAAANYLQMQDLKRDILSQLAQLFERDVDRRRSYQREEKFPLTVLEKISGHAQISEWIEFRACVRPAIRYGYMEPVDLVNIGRELPGSSFLLAVMVECYNDLLNSFACNRCQANQKNPCEPNLACKGCNNSCATGYLTVKPEHLE
ncbi:hypothetical protein AA313_de0208989 [Arthrobotrys entomopaga]|nr:hypothetical protein AA313_de0208989 [Arthrobotrys entomopaga]